MKLHLSLALLMPCAVLANPGASPKEKPVFRDAVTHEQLVKRMKVADQIDPMKKLEVATGDDPSKANQPADLLESSDVISFNGLATLVPKRAILASPKGVKDRVGMQKGVKIVGWSEFLELNRGWITTVEVTRVQAEGNKAIAPEISERISESANLVVATYMGGPISVLPLKEEAKKEQASISKP